MSKITESIAAGERECGARLLRATVAATIEPAETRDGHRRVRGYANTFRLMHSGRVFAPQAFDRWLKAHAVVDLPLLANHGLTTEGLGTIGRVDVLRVEPGRGLYFESTVGHGTRHADEARALIEQKLLTRVSLAWHSRRDSLVQRGAKDVPAWLAAELERSDLQRAWVFWDVDPAEISLVDVADDAGAKLVAGPKEQLAGELAAPLSAQLAELNERLSQLSALSDQRSAPDAAEAIKPAVEAALQAVNEQIKDFAHGLENRLCEVIEARLVDLSAAYLDDCGDQADDVAAAEEADGQADAPARPQTSATDSEELRARLAEIERLLTARAEQQGVTDGGATDRHQAG